MVNNLWATKKCSLSIHFAENGSFTESFFWNVNLDLGGWRIVPSGLCVPRGSKRSADSVALQEQPRHSWDGGGVVLIQGVQLKCPRRLW